MTDTAHERRIKKLSTDIEKLSDGQLDLIEPVIQELLLPYIDIYRSPSSDLINQCFLENFGDAIRIHHCFSTGSFTKDKFEYASEEVFQSCGREAKLAPAGNAGYDLILDGSKYSLKTEAERSIKIDKLHISKFMELGRGKWELELLRDQFLRHLSKYDKILTLRCLSRFYEYEYYELVEIPKDLLQEASYGQLRIMQNSKLLDIKPGYCDIFKDDELKFQLYFDGGGERKLQIKNLLKKYCTVHAYWKFGKSRFYLQQANQKTF